ncbi:MAG: tryptophan synthase subunit alpha [bacterium]|nr:tryptophan synthase subunit alpha [bacterium]
MNRIDARFRELRRAGRAGFVAYLTAGDPSPGLTPRLVLALERGGADVIELGVPFSDPLADGVVNQRAAERALRRGVTLGTVLRIVGAVRVRSAVPIVLFTYINPVLAYGIDRFAADAAGAGVDGVLALDLPPEESAACERALRARSIRPIFLVSPVTPPRRVAMIARRARGGFIYYVSRLGVTGARPELAAGIARAVRAIRSVTAVPVAVGFGISTPAQVRAAAGVADAVVVGSRLVAGIERGGTPNEIVARMEETARRLSAPLRRR